MAVQSAAGDMKTLQSQAMEQMNSRSSLEVGTNLGKNIDSTMLQNALADDDLYQPSKADIFDEFLA